MGNTANMNSFGYQQAWFLFALTRDGAMVRLFLVEAKNPWAIQTLERVTQDGRVSPTCELLSVSRHASVDFRSRKLHEVKYVDFMLDIVEHGRVLQNAVVASTFEQSLTAEEKYYANAKLEQMMHLEARKPRLIPVGTPPPAFPPPPELMEAQTAPMVIDVEAEVFDSDSSVIYQQALAALTDLGFKKPQAKKILDDMGAEVETQTIEGVIKTALQRLQAA